MNLPKPERARFLKRLTEPEADALLHDWNFCAADHQLTPAGDWWETWLFMAGRGAGKTRTGAETVRQWVREGVKRIALIGPTNYDTRHTMVEGVSGLLAVCWERDTLLDGTILGRPHFEPGNKRVVWSNGAMATLFSAEEPERLRGPQFEKAWNDEVGAWKRADETWDQLQFGLRLGAKPQAVVTTTPRPIPLLRELVRNSDALKRVGSIDDPATVSLTRARTLDNARNLSPRFIRSIEKTYGGTRLGRQELDGELIEEVEGALWRRAWFEREGFRIEKCPSLRRVVVAVDPPAGVATTRRRDDGSLVEDASEGSALCGIVVAGIGEDGRCYILADLSARLLPAAWGKRVVDAFELWGADLIVAESNQGGEMVRSTIRTSLPNAPVKLVHAYRGKFVRAEPVSALYEQGRVSHVGRFVELEDQLCTWEANGEQPSPDRLDACVYAVQALMIGTSFEWYVGS